MRPVWRGARRVGRAALPAATLLASRRARAVPVVAPAMASRAVLARVLAAMPVARVTAIRLLLRAWPWLILGRARSGLHVAVGLPDRDWNPKQPLDRFQQRPLVAPHQ